MRLIPFHYIDKDRLNPLEEFLYEKYRLQLDDIPGPEDFPPSMAALAEKHPDIAQTFRDFCRRVQNPKLTEERYLSNDLDISVSPQLRYLPKPAHTHQFFEILFVLEGHCTNIVEQTRLTLRKGDLCFLAPDVPHQSVINNHETIVYNILVRSSTFQNSFASIYGKNNIISDFFTRNLYRKTKEISPYILCKTDCEDIFVRLIDKMIEEELNCKKFANRYLNTLFEQFILELLRRHENHFTIGESTLNVEYESISVIMHYIQSNHRTLTLSEAARFFNYSEAHLSRMIKRFTGQNYSGIIKTIKLKKATSLLLETNKSVSEIVEEIGYTDNSHFYKTFKQHYGITPLQYKTQHARSKA